jgi:O-acetyl-ADP-ribose deacetylase (regulator of RNase III)
MGAGVAFAIAKKWPEVYDADKQTPRGDYKKLGTIGVVKLKNPEKNIKYVINQYSQHTFGRDRRYTNYEAFYNCLVHIRETCEKMEDVKTIGFPYKIGCNLAGGNWKIVVNMIETVFEDSSLDVVICKI